MHYGRLKFAPPWLSWLVLSGGLWAGVLLSAAPPDPPDSGLANTLQGMEDKYNRLKTVRMRFVQIYRQNRQVLRQEEGTLYLRKPGQMRWEYESPEPKLFLTDGRLLTLYVPGENRATQMAVKEADDLRTPLRFLLGRLRFDKEFQTLERSRDFPPLETGNLVVKGVPRQMADRVAWMAFEVGEELKIRRLIIEEPGGVQTEFRFEDETGNLSLPAQLFRFQPPAGTEIVRQ